MHHQLPSPTHADDTQILGSCRPHEVGHLTGNIFPLHKRVVCVTKKQYILLLNQFETEVIWFSSSSRQDQVPPDPACVANTALVTVKHRF